MKVIFLDYDGVLNNPYYLVRKKITHHGVDDLDPRRIVILKQICDLSGASVVLTSLWRDNETAKNYLIDCQIPIIDSVRDGGCRGQAIDLWLDEHDVEAYAILDDETSEYSPTQMWHLLCTREAFADHLLAEYDCVMGLQEKHIKWVVALLTEEEE